MLAPPHDSPRDDLGRFTCHRLRELGLSYRRAAARAIDPRTGQAVGFGWISKLTSGKLTHAPRPWQLRALAAGLGVPAELTTSLAAQQWLHYQPAQPHPSPAGWALYARCLLTLPDEDKETLRVVAEQLLLRREHTAAPAPRQHPATAAAATTISGATAGG